MDMTQDDSDWRAICRRLARNTLAIRKKGKKRQVVKEQNNGNESKRARKNRLRAEAKEVCGHCKHIEFIIQVPVPIPQGAVVAPNARRFMPMCCCANADSEHFMQVLNSLFGCAQFERREPLKKIELIGGRANAE